MARICPNCKTELGEGAKKSAWVPILTTVGVSAAALIVFQQVRKANSCERKVENALSSCTRAASALDQRIDETVRIAS